MYLHAMLPGSLSSLAFSEGIMSFSEHKWNLSTAMLGEPTVLRICLQVKYNFVNSFILLTFRAHGPYRLLTENF